jgi:hypothetical protein
VKRFTVADFNQEANGVGPHRGRSGRGSVRARRSVRTAHDGDTGEVGLLDGRRGHGDVYHGQRSGRRVFFGSRTKSDPLACRAVLRSARSATRSGSCSLASRPAAARGPRIRSSKRCTRISSSSSRLDRRPFARNASQARLSMRGGTNWGPSWRARLRSVFSHSASNLTFSALGRTLARRIGVLHFPTEQRLGLRPVLFAEAGGVLDALAAVAGPVYQTPLRSRSEPEPRGRRGVLGVLMMPRPRGKAPPASPRARSIGGSVTNACPRR